MNTASRMESTSLPLEIQISVSTNELLENLGGFVTIPRGRIPVKVISIAFKNEVELGYKHKQSFISDQHKTFWRY